MNRSPCTDPVVVKKHWHTVALGELVRKNIQGEDEWLAGWLAG